MALNLRRLTEVDVPQVIQIQRSITRREVSERWQKMLSQHVADPDLPCFVAEEASRVVGFILGEIRVGNFGSDLTGWLVLVGVVPEMMGAGIGRALARRLMDYYAEQGVPEVCTAVRWDSGDMLAFFKNLGFDRSPFINLHRTQG